MSSIIINENKITVIYHYNLLVSENKVSTELLEKVFSIDYVQQNNKGKFMLAPATNINGKLLDKSEIALHKIFFFDIYKKDLLELLNSGTTKKKYYVKNMNL
jgi:hypothetical protein